jgi:hypothetical protein
MSLSPEIKNRIVEIIASDLDKHNSAIADTLNKLKSGKAKPSKTSLFYDLGEATL